MASLDLGRTRLVRDGSSTRRQADKTRRKTDEKQKNSHSRTGKNDNDGKSGKSPRKGRSFAGKTCLPFLLSPCYAFTASTTTATMDVSVVAAVGSFVMSERVLKPKATVLVILGCLLAYDLTTKTHDISSLRVYRGGSCEVADPARG